jgi:hypothetical protein
MVQTNTQMLSRRMFLSQCCASVIAPLAAFEPGIEIKLAREFKNAYLVAISPAGDRMCLYFSEQPVQTFPWPQAAGERGAAPASREELLVVETGSGKTVFSHRLRKQAYRGSFFQDGERLYVETLAFPDGDRLVSQRAVIDVESGKIDDSLRTEQPNGASIFYSALKDEILLGAEIDGRTRRTQALLRAKLPDYREVARAPYALAARQPSGNSTDTAISGDRRLIAYAVDGFILCRRTDDLEVVWRKPVEPGMRAWRVAMSSDGTRLAVASVDTAFVEQQRNFSIGVYNTEDGSRIARLSVNGFEGIGISPGGKYLAVGQRIDSTPQDAQPTIQVYDIASGQRVATAIHDRIHSQPGQRSYGSFINNGLQFTADGKYLVTSGVNTKVWTVDYR